MINLSFDNLLYYTLMSKRQELARELVGNPNVPLEIQGNKGSVSPEMKKVGRREIQAPTMGTKKQKLKGQRFWYQNIGNMEHECLEKKAGNTQVKSADQAPKANLDREVSPEEGPKFDNGTPGLDFFTSVEGFEKE